MGNSAVNVNPYIAPFTGDSGSGGAAGLVPAPSAGDAADSKVLGAGGAWKVEVPIGCIMMWAASTVPTGWLELDGSAISRATYSKLFNVLSTTYGIGNGSTTFNLPDFRGRAPIGAGTGQANYLGDTNSALTNRTLGSAVGRETHTLSVPEMPSHGHVETHSGADAGQNQISRGGGGSATTNSQLATASTGGGGAHNNMQPSLPMKFIIKAQ